jgi:hypothetical protein
MNYLNEGLPSYIEVDTQHQGVVMQSMGNTLDEVYGRYSDAKAGAYARCEEICDEMDGRNLCITSANCHMFSVQFEFSNPMNGRPMVCHITPKQTYAMYTDMRHISEAHMVWRHYAHDMVYISVIGWDDRDYCGCGVRWMAGTAYVYVEDEAYRVDNPFTKDGKLRLRPMLSKAGA